MSRKIKNIRTPSKRILVLCEGITEKIYLLSIKERLPRYMQRGVRIEIDSYKKNDPKSLVDETIRRKEKAAKAGVPYDEVWIVFDHDNLPNRDYAFKKSKAKGVKIAYSSISIEIWFIIHFEDKQRKFQNGNEAKKYLAKHYIKGYKPGKTKVWEYLDDNKRKRAFKNAQAIRKSKKGELLSGSQEWDLNPYTTIDKLIETILKQK